MQASISSVRCGRDDRFAGGRSARTHLIQSTQMTVTMLEEAELDLQEAFYYYESCREGLGLRLINEFRAAVDRMLFFPRGWRSIDETYRVCQLHKFPYGIIYE